MPSESKYNSDSDSDQEETKSSSSSPPNKPQTSLIKQVSTFFYENDAFMQKFETFVNANAHIIDDHEIETTGLMKFEYTALYEQYQNLLETELTEFIDSIGGSVSEFYGLLSKASEDDLDGEVSIFGQILTATADFDVFLMMMREAAQQQDQEREGR